MNVVAFAPVRSSPRPLFASDPTPRDGGASIATIGRGARDTDADETPDDRAVAGTLRKIVASATFRHSKRHQAFLGYLVEAVLERRGASLKEVVIGLEVFGRCIDGYDPHRDSIVRVEARRLRAKLAHYYANEGRHDPIEIRLPVGRYTPVFVLRGPLRVATSRPPLFVVLPLLTGSGPAASANGIADRVVQRLGEMDGVSILAPMTAATLREHPDDIDDFAKTHGVDFVIDGTLVAHGARARCIVHLSRMRDRLRVWSGHFDFADEDGTIDWLSAQDRVADDLAAVVARTLDADRDAS